MRLVTTVAVFVLTVILLIIVGAAILGELSKDRVIGIAFVKGSADVVVVLVIFVLLGAFSYWLAGKITR